MLEINGVIENVKVDLLTRLKTESPFSELKSIVGFSEQSIELIYRD